jgi:4-hydroxyphenylpyruvate dioxygenase-like putative hemolysin
MTEEHRESKLHHVVFAVAPERHDVVAELFTDLGFVLEALELTELGLHVHLDWNRGVELISPLAGSTETVANSVREFLDGHGDGIYTVVLRVPDTAAAESVTERYGGTTRFRQSFSDDGSYLAEVDLSVFGLPLTFLSTNLP